GLALLAVSPVAFLAAVFCVFAVLRQVRRHWWEWALTATAAAVVVGLIMQIATGNVLIAHYGGFSLAFAGQGSWLDAVARTMPLGVPLGLAAGAAYVGLSESWSGGAEWHPIEQHRRAVNETKAEQRVSSLLATPEAAKRCSAPPLGVCRGGDLSTWIEGRFVVPPTGKFPAMGLLGESGSGKTVTAERLVTIWAKSGRKVIFADFKGSDPELAERIVAAYKNERGPDVACALWPAMPLDIWRGSPTEIANRLLQVQDFTEPYYAAAAETAVRLAVHAPDVDRRGPVRDSASFMHRLDAEFLKRAYEQTPQARDVTSVTRRPDVLDGVRLRYSGFFSALAGRLDHGFSFEDVDLAVLTVPTLAQQADAMAVARMILTDFGAYCLQRKPRIGEDVTFIVDEFSAVTSAAPMVIDLAERVRDVGGQVVVSAQSYEGLGRDEAERRRMRDALASGGLVVHRLAEPDEVVKVAGTVRAMEQSWQLESHGHTGLGTVKMAHKMKVDPDETRQARTGEAWVITHGRAARMSVLRSRISEEVREQARRLVDAAHWQATADLSHGSPPKRQDWWELPLEPGPRRPQLEAGSLGELLAGDPPPPELGPGPPKPIDPRLMLTVVAYVRANLVTQARQIAAAAGYPDPDRYVDRMVVKRASVVAGDPGRRRRPAFLRKGAKS
ncbi:MAG TPA: hypothetical protein VJY33_17640, partial [Isosphaeraceae bacterium]|nr:hypothetical protein [Isosphaeraceae bacterium]